MGSDILHVTVANPLAGTEAVCEIQAAQSTEQEAQQRAVTIRTQLERAAREIAPVVIKAYLHRDWIALGYENWDAYVKAEFGIERLLSGDERATLAGKMRVEGMSLRAIGTALGASPRTVRRDLVKAGADVPDNVVSLDGRKRPATQSEQAEVAEDPFVPPRETQWPDPVHPCLPVVNSETPGGTVEPPPSPRGWRRMAEASLRHVHTNLHEVTGDFTEVSDFAGRATDEMIEDLASLADRLSGFVRDVRALRGRHTVWMSAESVGGTFHEPGADGSATCGRSLAAGRRLPEVQARALWNAQPCDDCYPVA